MIRRLICLFRDHDWEGYGQMPLAFIRCRRCGLIP